MKKMGEELLSEVITILKKEEGFEFEKNADGDDGSKTKSTKIGNYLWLRATGNIFIPAIYNKRAKEGILKTIDTLVKKIIFVKFPIFISGIIYFDQNPAVARQVAKTITKAFEFYERLWKKLLSEQELASLIPEAVIRSETEEEQF